MCQLQEIRFSCGHSRKALQKACASARRLSIAPVRLPPIHCLNGLHICQRTKSPGSKVIDEKVMEIRQVIDNYHTRMVNIKDALELFEQSLEDKCGPLCGFRHTLTCPNRQAQLRKLSEKFLLATFPRWDRLVQEIVTDMDKTCDEFLKSLQDNDKQAHHDNPAVRKRSLNALAHEADCLVERFGNACWVWKFDMTCMVDSAESDAGWEGLADVGWLLPRPEDTQMMAVLEQMLSVRQRRDYYRTGRH